MVTARRDSSTGQCPPSRGPCTSRALSSSILHPLPQNTRYPELPICHSSIHRHIHNGFSDIPESRRHRGRVLCGFRLYVFPSFQWLAEHPCSHCAQPLDNYHLLAITRQIEHKLLKRGFQFNVMAVGAFCCYLLFSVAATDADLWRT